MSPPDEVGVDGAVVVVVGGAVVVVVGGAVVVVVGGAVVVVVGSLAGGAVVTGAPPAGGVAVAGTPAGGTVVDVVVVDVVVVGVVPDPLDELELPPVEVVIVVGWPTMGRTPRLPNSVSSSWVATERQSDSTRCASSALALA
jgi:hypothetical protein